MKNKYKCNFDMPQQRLIPTQSGVTLIEALVTLLVISVGALGIASMQLAGLKYTSGSYARTQAVILADDMANRLKSNRVFAVDLDDDGDVSEDDSPYELADFNTPNPVANAVDCLTVMCTETQLRDYDIETWRNELARVLPSGRGSITTEEREVGNGITEREFNIAIQWRQVSNSTQIVADQDDELRSFTFRILL